MSDTLPTPGYIAEGILLPLMAHRFRVLFPSRYPPVLTAQVTKCAMSFSAKTLSIVIEQSNADVGLLEAVAEIMGSRSPQKIVVDMMTGAGETVSRINFLGLCAVNHEFVLDYALNQTAVHHLEFTFSGVDVTTMIPTK